MSHYDFLSNISPELRDALHGVVLAAASTGLNNVLIVDAASPIPAAAQKGTSAAPFSTIQAALDAIPEATTGARTRKMSQIFVAEGTYDEDLAVDITGRRIQILSLGPWNLGKFDGSTWQPSGTRRNITIDGDPASIDNIRVYFGIMNLIEGGNRGGAVSNSFTNPRISGQISCPIVGPNSIIEMDIEAEIYGDTGFESGVSFDVPNNASITINFIRSAIRAQIVGGDTAANSNLELSRLYQSRFRGDVLAGGISLVRECDCEEDWTINGSAGGSSVLGFTTSIFEGVMDCDSSAFVMRVDPYTQAQMLAQGGTIVNGFKEFRYTGGTTVFAGGAAIPSAGQHLEAHAGTSGIAGVLGVDTEIVIPRDGNLSRITWNSASADATTVLKIVVDSSVVATVTLTGASGSLDLSKLAVGPVQPQVAAGSKIAVEYDAGTAPGAMTAQVLLQ